MKPKSGHLCLVRVSQVWIEITVRYCGASLKWPEFFSCFHFLFPILLSTAPVDICASGLCLTCAAKMTHCHSDTSVHNNMNLHVLVFHYIYIFLYVEWWLRVDFHPLLSTHFKLTYCVFLLDPTKSFGNFTLAVCVSQSQNNHVWSAW